jgi:hypothetical protein
VLSHTGDGAVAAFASPKSAVDAAVAAQQALELPVRMGIATGEAEIRDDDYFGAVLNRAARVMAAVFLTAVLMLAWYRLPFNLLPVLIVDALLAYGLTRRRRTVT